MTLKTASLSFLKDSHPGRHYFKISGSLSACHTISYLTFNLYDPVSFIIQIKWYTIYFIMDDTTKKELQSAAFERLIHHLRERTDVQNIDLMNLAGFCRNCLSKWYREEAQKKGIEISDPDARKHVYGMPYDEWKKKFWK